MAPSTFASAAAGNTASSQRDNAPDWSRRTNGATQTFRRPSGAATTPTAAHPADTLAHQQPPRYVPPHRNGSVVDTRYSKDQLLELFRAQQSVDGGLSDGLPNLYVGGWQPDVANGTVAGWGRTEHNRDAQPGPDVCWDRDGTVGPLGLIDMDDDEREMFLTTVNTPIKPPTTNKENAQSNGLPGRKVSVSNNANTPGGFGLPSPNVTRGTGRRRETSESYPFPQSNPNPSGTFDRDQQRAASPPAALLRRRTDLKDPQRPEEKEVEEKQATTPFGSLKRHPSGSVSAGFNAPSSPWGTGSQSAGLTPMGSFGNFGGGGAAVQAGNDKRTGLSGGRAESRFKNLLNKDAGEDAGVRPLERKPSLSRVNENESWRPQDRPEPPNESLDEADEEVPTGSAALAADADISPPHPRQGFRGFGTPSRQGTRDEFGFGAFGMTSDNNTIGFGQGAARDAFQQTPAQSRVGPQVLGNNEPMSPTDTNPYQSPEQHGVDQGDDVGDDGQDFPNPHLPGLGHFAGDPSQQLSGLGGLGALPNFARPHGTQGPASDRSQTSSVGPNRGFPSLGGLGQLGNGPGSAAWPVSQGGLGTPGRQTAGLSSAFGGGVFGSQMSDLQSPGLAGLGGANLMSPHGGAYGGSRMASMFPQAMQDQMRQGDGDPHERAPQTFAGLGDIRRSVESPFNSQNYAQNQDGKPAQDSGDGQQSHFNAPGQQPQPTSGQPQDQAQAQQQNANQPVGSSASSQPPAPQQRTMVMPDRMRWIYRDPQGQTQGPWTGLEMHDWYKAGFFSPELLVKKFEDPDYEPLAQLIRRIGNSREPFLVPQIGIPHGVATSTGPTPWAGPGTMSSAPAPTAGGAQPPFASSFPSFGTTLTAEQQNALERRKQEEQYLMARQKEHLAQAQIAQRMQMQSGHPNMTPGQLHHHSSAHSLQSQPSFGSMTSPTAYQPSPTQGPTGAATASTQGFFDNSYRSPQAGLGAVGAGVDSLGRIREEEIPSIMDRLNLGGRAAPGQFGAPGQPSSGQQPGQQQPVAQDEHERQVQQMLQDRARLEQEQSQHDGQQQTHEQQAPSNDRLHQFQQLQGEIQGMDRFQAALQKPVQQAASQGIPPSHNGMEMSSGAAHERPQEPLSLTEQVQKAASAKQSPVPQQPGLPQPFPPAPSQSPLPAPAAQRTGRQSVADQLQTESRDLSQTPSVETPSAAVAPWAKEPAEAPRGPSLREIQEMEAKQAAEAEETAAAARRAAFQREMEAQAQSTTTAPAPGLPTTSTWAAGSPATPTGAGAAAWAKTAQKPTTTNSSKTLAQIQKEEEARKRKMAAAVSAAQNQANIMSAVQAPAGGKSYANLAGKVTSPAPTNTATGAWTTVGAGGKPKTPAGGAPAPVNRSASSGIVPTVQSPAVAPRKPAVRSTTMGAPGAVNAQDEFKKWAVGELRPDLNKGISAEDFVAGLAQLPPESDIITEAVHGVSSTIDSRHFAEEFIRRKRLADKGLIDNSIPKTGSPAHAADKNGGGWSQVAKKGPAREEAVKDDPSNGSFRVVPSKKKGGKR